MATIMIIDDSEADQFLAANAIEQALPNVNVIQAYDGREALDKLTSMTEKPVIIFLDINMPVMNGHEFLEEYDKLKPESSVVVMLTSSSADRDLEISRHFKCVRQYLAKPLEATDLVDLFDSCSLSA